MHFRLTDDAVSARDDPSRRCGKGGPRGLLKLTHQGAAPGRGRSLTSAITLFPQEMLHSCITVLLSLVASLLFWSSAVRAFQCYRCDSLQTPSCSQAGNTNGWTTCRDDMCLTGIGFAQIPFFGKLTVTKRVHHVIHVVVFV